MPTLKQKERNKKVIDKLEKQLKGKTKNSKKGNEVLSLTEKDIERIQKELEILKNRI